MTPQRQPPQEPGPQPHYGGPDPRGYQQPGYHDPGHQQPSMYYEQQAPDVGYPQQWGKPQKPWWQRRVLKLPVWLWIATGGFLFIAIVGSTAAPPDEAADTDATDAPTTVEVTSAQVSSPPSAAAPPATEAPAPAPASTTPAPAFSVQAWFIPQADLFTATTEEMNNFATAASEIDLPEVERTGRVVSANMEILAKSLDNETDPSAVLLRNAFNSCSVAYGTAAEAASDIDVDGLEVAADLINGCSEALGDAIDVMGS